MDRKRFFRLLRLARVLKGCGYDKEARHEAMTWFSEGYWWGGFDHQLSH